MIVMPANSTGMFFHSLARETGRLGHLYSPAAQCGPWPWFPYALDNGAFSCWEPKSNTFDDGKWRAMEAEWNLLILWAQSAPIAPLWAIVPDVPGNAPATFEKYARFVHQMGRIPRALAVQDGMTVEQVQALEPPPRGNRGRRLHRLEVGHRADVGGGVSPRPCAALQRAGSALRHGAVGRGVLRRHGVEPGRPHPDPGPRAVGEEQGLARHLPVVAARMPQGPRPRAEVIRMKSKLWTVWWVTDTLAVMQVEVMASSAAHAKRRVRKKYGAELKKRWTLTAREGAAE